LPGLAAVGLGALAALLAASPALAAGEEWPQFQKSADNSGVTAEAAPLEAPAEVWSAFTHYRSTHGIDVTPIVAGGRVFVIDVEGVAWAFDVDDGGEVWNTALVEDYRYKIATPAWGEDKVFFATDAGYIYALDDVGGAVLWSGRLTAGSGQQAELSTQIVYDAGRIYVGSWEGKYYCLDVAGDGGAPKIEWTYEVPEVCYDWYSGAVVIGDYVLFGNKDGLLTCVTKAGGNQVDTCDLSDKFEVEAGSIRSAVSTSDDRSRIYLTSRNGYVFAIDFDTTTGQFIPDTGWHASIDNYSTSTPVYHDGYVYVCSGGSFYGQEGGLYCFDAADGHQEWFNDLGVTYGSQASPAISVQDGSLYIYLSTGAPHSAVVCIDGGGTMLWEHVPSHTEYSLQGVAIYGGKVFFGNDAGYLYALGEARWDVNDDGAVNISDLVLVGSCFGETGEPGWIAEDVNGDGAVDISDLVVIGNHFGE
jgi:outer membrane protein assembly factor BamB